MAEALSFNKTGSYIIFNTSITANQKQPQLLSLML